LRLRAGRTRKEAKRKNNRECNRQAICMRAQVSHGRSLPSGDDFLAL
jgi:hypothetical protein